MIMGMCIGCSPYNAEQTVITQAIAVLRKYGQDAHIYLPGAGMLNGLTAANYLDSAGTTVGTVDQPVGLVLDAAGGFGVELVTVPTVVAVPIGGPAFTSYAVGPATFAGKTYSVTFTVSDYSGTGNVSLDGGTGQWVVNPSASGDSSLAGNGTKSFIIQCAASALLRVFSRSTNTCTFSSISVREVTGIAASQPTTASKPILRRGALNLLTYSGDFSNAAWVKSGVTATPSQPDPIGGRAAFKLVASLGTSTKQLTNSASTGLGAKTGAIYLKQAELQFVRITFTDNVSGDFQATLNLSTGALSSQVSSGTWTGQSITATNVNGWWLVVGVGTNATNPLVVIKLNIQTTPGADSAVGDGTSGIFAFTAGLFAGTYTAQQIQALGGIPLTTTAPASTALGPQYWQFDGSNDSLSLGGPLFQMADDHCVVAGANCQATVSWRTIFGQGGATATPRMQLVIDAAAGKAIAYWRDDAGANSNVVGSTDLRNATSVITARATGQSRVLRVNGALNAALNTTVLGVSTLTHYSIGGLGSVDWFNGNIYPVIAIKGTVTDPDLLLLEKLVGQLSGVQI